MSDDNKLSLSGRGLPGAGRGRETGKVRQNFSHGRSKPVVVEHRKKRLLKKGGVAPEVPAPAAVPAPASAAAEKALFKPKPQPQAPSGAGSLTSRELDERKRALASLEEERSRQEEDRRRVEEEARRRQEEERRRKAEEEAVRNAAEAARAAEGVPVESGEELATRRAEEHARKLAEQAAKRAAEDKIRKKAEAEARKKAEEEESAREEQRKKADDKRPEKRIAGREDEDEAGKRSRSRRGRGGDNRRSGKLSVTRAFEGEEGEERRRSLAAFRRAQAKRRGGRSIQEQSKQAREVVIPESITVQELANRMAEKAVDVIRVLMNMDIMATINDRVDPDTAELVVTELGHTPRRVLESDVEIGLIGDDDPAELKRPRPAVVTIMGHVDHGKTSLLDALRQTDVASGEAGGITQHIGAYQVELPGGAKITFLDTPGHEAFTQMRARGAGVTDIVILVVAADDGVMPQTVEAISHARAAGVPIIVAINKMDAPGANPDRVRQELLQHDIQVEAMGGDVLDIEVSALKKTNLDKLEEAILLQAELLELAANPDRPADGVVVEARLEKGRGPVATVLVRRGTLRIGDIFVAGAETGRVRAMIDERGRQLDEAGPARPVEILGLNGAPAAGDDFAVVENENRAREISAYRQSELRKRRQVSGPASVESMFTQLREKKAESFPVIVKGDVQGSVEAIVQTLEKIGGEDIKVRVLHAAAGAVTESDITLAKASDCMIISFNVRANKQARDAAERDGVIIKYYSVIYNLVDEMKAAMAGQLGPVIEETTIGTASVRDVFTAGKAGKAAGCFVEEGVMKRGAKARLLRDDTVVYTGRIVSVRRFKDDVEEVRSGTECGVTLENFSDIKSGDTIEAFTTEERERVL